MGWTIWRGAQADRGAGRRWSWLLAILLVAVAPLAGAAQRPAVPAHVYVVVVDGLGRALATRERMPVLFDATAVHLAGRAAMPTRTNPNHASILTGVHPGAHGVTGNGYWSRNPDDGPAALEEPGLLDVETIFTVAERDAPALVTIAVFSKPKLRTLFSAAAGRQQGPDEMWAPRPGSDGADDTGYASDAAVMDAVLALTRDREPDVTVVNLGDVDRISHARGPDHPDVAAAVVRAGAAVERLVGSLRARGRWERSVVVVTADHGFDAVGRTAANPRPTVEPSRALRAAGLGRGMIVAEGGVAHVYAAGVAPDAAGLGEATSRALARVAAAAVEVPGVAGVYARLPVPGVPSLPPEWHLEHERVGDLLLVAADGFQFVGPARRDDKPMAGNHGGPGEIAVPTVVLGGHPLVRRIDAARTPTSADVGATAFALLGLRGAQRVDGTPVPESLRGHALVP